VYFIRPCPCEFARCGRRPTESFRGSISSGRTARDEIERLIDWLDSTIDVDHTAVDDGPCDGDADAEPSLGSFDRMSNQIKAWAHRGWGDVDMELERADDEDGDPTKHDERPLQMQGAGAGRAVQS
jgi:hypothetical protein